MSNIPKIIWQTCLSDYNDLPEYVKVCSDSWKNNNEGWEYRYLTHEDCYKMILDNYDQDMADIYLNIDHPQIKADFWRYLSIYKFGGVYIDIDVISFSNIDSFLPQDKDAFFIPIKNPIADRKTEYAMWFFGCSPENPILKEVIELMISKLKSLDSYSIASDQETGWPVWNAAIDKFVDEEWFYVLSDIEAPMLHYGANSKWTDNYVTRRPMETFYWDMGSSLDIKVSNKAYSSLKVHK
jgi:mannosyltransferase OCH1-like enzyme